MLREENILDKGKALQLEAPCWQLRRTVLFIQGVLSDGNIIRYACEVFLFNKDSLSISIYGDTEKICIKENSDE